MSKITENSIWPNGIKDDTEGYTIFYPLGTNKVTVPVSKWPKGDEYIYPFVYENKKLVGFIDSAALTLDEPLKIYLPYEHIDIKFPNIEKGTLQIHAPKATTKKVSWSDGVVEDIPEVEYKYKGCKTVDEVKTVDANYMANDIINGEWIEPMWDLENSTSMFQGCSNLNTFKSDLPSLTFAEMMFYECVNLTTFEADLSRLDSCEMMFDSCENLTTFKSDLSNLTYGRSMFYYCPKLTSFSSDLSKMDVGANMFDFCENLTTFKSDLSSLTNASAMFRGCSNLTSFHYNLSKMTYGGDMFKNCSKLTSFCCDLSSLNKASQMFYGCKLDNQSIANIIPFLQQRNAKPTTEELRNGAGVITFGLGITNTDEEKQALAEECECADWTELNKVFDDKNWIVEWQFNGESSTFDLRSPRPSTAVFARLEEVIIPTNEKKHKHYYEYTSQDGSKFYNLDWFHETTGSTESYTQFNSLEEAIETLNIKPIERN